MSLPDHAKTSTTTIDKIEDRKGESEGESNNKREEKVTLREKNVRF